MMWSLGRSSQMTASGRYGSPSVMYTGKVTLAPTHSSGPRRAE